MDISVRKDTFITEDRSWLGSAHGTDSTDTVTLDPAAFDQTTHFPNGFVLSGTALSKITATGLYGPYSGTTDEVQTVTEGGSGLTSFTLTLSGQTTGSIAAGATAAAVQTAIAALSNVGAGNVKVTGVDGGPYTVSFIGALLDTNVAQMTATPTGGTGSVTVATLTGGGVDGSSDGREVGVGLLFNTTAMKVGGAKVGAPMFMHGAVVTKNLPANSGVDANFKTDVAGRIRFK